MQAEHDHGQQPRAGAGAGEDSGVGEPRAAARQQEVYLLRHGQECRDRHQLAAEIEVRAQNLTTVFILYICWKRTD